MSDPSQPPIEARVESLSQPKHYVGIRRLPYLGVIIVLAILQGFLAPELAHSYSSGAGALFMVVYLFPAYYRLKNIGMNPWWCLLMLVPLANLLVVFRCLAFQEGYEDTKKLDTAGKVITFLVLGFVILLIIGGVF